MGDWNLTKGKLKQRWASLTDDDLTFANGRSDELLRRLQALLAEAGEVVEKAIKRASASHS